MRKTKVTHNGTEKPSVESQIVNSILCNNLYFFNAHFVYENSITIWYLATTIQLPNNSNYSLQLWYKNNNHAGLETSLPNVTCQDESVPNLN